MYKFIIVDDEPLIRQGLLKKIRGVTEELSFCGEADNGEDALELVRTADPHLIFTDMRMPVMDGKSLLRQLQSQYPDKKIIVISGYSDFEYMQEAISARVVHYLLKPFSKEEILGAISKAVTAIESEQSAKAETQNITREAEQLSLLGDMHALLQYVAGFYPAQNPPVFRSAPMRNLMSSSRMVLLTLYNPEELAAQEPVLERTHLFLPHPQSRKLAFSLQLCDASLKDSEVLELAASEARKLIAGIGPQACIGISTVKSAVTELPQAREESISALNCRAIADQGQFFHYHPGSYQAGPVMWEGSGDLIFFIESGNTEKVTELVHSYFEYYRGQPAATIHQLKENCRYLIAEVKALVSAYFPTQGGQHPSSSLEAVLGISFDAEEIRHYFLTVLTSIAELLKEQSVYSSPNVIDNVKVYIRKNISSPVTLEHLSSLFYISPSYLSFLFKDKTGENLIDYVNQERIERAKLLLRTSDDKIYKIAKALGIDNAKYFFRLFKKMTGYTPEEYRKQCDNGKGGGADGSCGA
ncbi:HTH-type transcriptional activator RhaR [Paenibacillus auburnensis]|uniref:HTH-type transcriptional activator RhaR n=1 Tax=Paenibacillus auburnensis TaxID=2905649 RepID=A0ABN8GF54_9BACL|nr:response regulator [Paenibacillus auburnensis]CAH1207620.1 HTH-type transcriptional activator RhaR [Paenibacillus auburnensis]